jgi:hypothetical protein
VKRLGLLARIVGGLSAAGLVALVISGSVLRPPVLMQAGNLSPERVRERLPGDAQRVELQVDERTTLRGWYVPADTGAPLVLHLLESTASVDSPTSSRALAARQLADLGFASLFVDYAGIGSSDGERSAAHLGRDARAMWDEALRRVDGDPARVVLRCTSIGTLAALPLLHGGARPAGVILLLPVLPDTLAERFAGSFYGRAASWLARAAFRRVVDEDLLEVVRETPTAWLAVQAARDQMTSAGERAAIELAVVEACGRAAQLEEDHLVGSLVLRALCNAEMSFLTEVVPGVRDIEARWTRFSEGLPEELREPVLSDAARVAGLRRHCGWSHTGDWRTLLAVADFFDDELLATRLRWWLEEPRYAKLDHEELRCVADLDDPGGRIPFEVLVASSRIESLSSRTFSFRPILGPDEIERHAREAIEGGGEPCASISSTFAGVESGVELHPGALLAQLRAHGLSDGDARRQLARALLKAYGIPDRCVTAADGTPRVEFRSKGAWHAIETDPSRPRALADGRPVAGVQFNLRLPTSD